MPKPACVVDGCERPFSARGLCGTHYSAARRGGTLVSSQGECSVDDCNDPQDARALCNRHYQRAKRHGGDPTAGRDKPQSGQTCTEPDCSAKTHAHGKCQKHYYQQWHRAKVERLTGKPYQPRVKSTTGKPYQPRVKSTTARVKPTTARVKSTANRTCSESDCSEKHYGRGFCRKHYSQDYARRTRKPEVHVVIKNGFDWDLEKQAEELLMRDRENCGESEQSDWLTNRQLASLAWREVYTKDGVPDASIMEGRVFRAYNPLIGKRPRRPETADW